VLWARSLLGVRGSHTGLNLIAGKTANKLNRLLRLYDVIRVNLSFKCSYFLGRTKIWHV